MLGFLIDVIPDGFEEFTLASVATASGQESRLFGCSPCVRLLLQPESSMPSAFDGLGRQDPRDPVPGSGVPADDR